MKISFRHKVFNVLNFIFMLLVGFVMFYPFYYIIIYSFSEPMQAAKGISFLPRGFTLANYETVFEIEGLGWAAFISVAKTVVGTVTSVLATSMFAYGLTKVELPGRKLMYRTVVLTMYVSGGIIPNYILLSNLHLKNTFLLYIIPGLISAFNLILVKTYMESLPIELEEAAQVEGAGYFKIYSSIIMPLSKPIIATISIFTAVNHWNSWFENLYLNTKPQLYTLQYIMYRLIQTKSITAEAVKANMVQSVQVTSVSIQMAVTVVAVVPILIVYPMFQKYFIGGIMIGAVKG